MHHGVTFIFALPKCVHLEDFRHVSLMTKIFKNKKCLCVNDRLLIPPLTALYCPSWLAIFQK